MSANRLVSALALLRADLLVAEAELELIRLEIAALENSRFTEADDRVYRFLRSTCRIVSGAATSAEALYGAYLAWLDPRPKLTPHEFGLALSRLKLPAPQAWPGATLALDRPTTSSRRHRSLALGGQPMTDQTTAAAAEPFVDDGERWIADLTTRVKFYDGRNFGAVDPGGSVALVQTWLLADVAETLHVLVADGRRRDGLQAQRDEQQAHRDAVMESLVPAMLASPGVRTDPVEVRS